MYSCWRHEGSVRYANHTNMVMVASGPNNDVYECPLCEAQVMVDKDRDITMAYGPLKED